MIRPSDEGGFTLTEVLIASTILLLVLGATLAAFNTFERTNRDNQTLNDTQNQVRFAMERLSRQLRNGASPTPELPEAIDRAQPFDLVFQTSDPFDPTVATGTNLRRVRYCLDATTATNARLWTMDLPRSTAMPASGDCPGATWQNQRIVTDHVVNVANSQTRPVFTYGPTGWASLTQVNRIRAQLWLDLDTGRRPKEVHLSSGVFLRNQNQAPVVPDFTATVAGNRHVLLNGSAATDPEGDTLTYTWYDGATKMACTGAGISPDCVATAAGLRSIKLVVSDGAGLKGELVKGVSVL